MSVNKRDTKGVMRKAKELRPDLKMAKQLRKITKLPIRTKRLAIRRKSLKKR